MNMKKLLLISMMLMTVLAMAACEDSGDEPFTPEHPELSGPSGGEDENESEVPDVSSLQVNIMVSNRTITATMEDNAATQDFRFFVKFGGTSSIVNKESWLSVVYFLPYCTSAFLPL